MEVVQEEAYTTSLGCDESIWWLLTWATTTTVLLHSRHLCCHLFNQLRYDNDACDTIDAFLISLRSSIWKDCSK